MSFHTSDLNIYGVFFMGLGSWKKFRVNIERQLYIKVLEKIFGVIMQANTVVTSEKP